MFVVLNVNCNLYFCLLLLTSQAFDRDNCLRNELYSIEWDVKLYLLTYFDFEKLIVMFRSIRL